MKGRNSAKVSNIVYLRRHFIHASVCTTSPSLHKRHDNRHVFFPATFPLVSLLTQWKLVRIHTGAYPHFWLTSPLSCNPTICLTRHSNNENLTDIKGEHLDLRLTNVCLQSTCFPPIIVISLAHDHLPFSFSHFLFHRNTFWHRRRWLINPFRKTRI